MVFWAAIGAAATEALFLVSPWASSPHRGLMLGVTAGIAGLGVWPAWRGPRVGDTEYHLYVMAGLPVAAVIIWVQIGPGRTAVTALGLLACTTLGALFSGRTGHVVAQIVTAEIVLWVVSWGVSSGPAGLFESLCAGFVLLVVTALIRLLHDMTVELLRISQINEITDPLTGLLNRRGLERLGMPLWANLARTGQSAAVLVIDVDHFKKINDAGGHAAGDELLRRLGDLLLEALRAGDIAARLGGEEFVVLGATEPGGAADLGERVRRTVEDRLPPVTVSIGTHEVRPAASDTTTTLWGALDAGDCALYAAKIGGRNRVVSSARATAS